MARPMHAHERKITMALDLPRLIPHTAQLQILQRHIVKLLLARPLQGLRPRMVPQPIANVIRVAGIDQHGDLLDDVRHQAVEGLHPVALEQEVSVDVEVAALVPADLDAQALEHLGLVQPVADVAQGAVAQVAAVLALAAHVVHVLARALVGPDHRVVAVDAGGYAAPDAFAVVTRLDQRLAARQRVVHGLALGLIQHGRPAALPASHGAVRGVLRQTVCQTVTDQHGLEVDVALLVRQDLGREDGDVVACVGLAGDVEVLRGVFGELLEEEGEQGVDVLACRDRVGHAAAAVGVADVDGLVQEDYACVVIPAIGVVDEFARLGDR